LRLEWEAAGVIKETGHRTDARLHHVPDLARLNGVGEIYGRRIDNGASQTGNILICLDRTKASSTAEALAASDEIILV